MCGSGVKRSLFPSTTCKHCCVPVWATLREWQTKQTGVQNEKRFKQMRFTERLALKPFVDSNTPRYQKQYETSAKHDFTANVQLAGCKIIHLSIWRGCVWAHPCCIRFKQPGSQDMTYSWSGFTTRSWQMQKNYFLELLPPSRAPPPPHPLPKRTVMLCHYRNKWLPVQKCIHNDGKKQQL